MVRLERSTIIQDKKLVPEQELLQIEQAKKDPAFFKPLYEKYFKVIFRFVHGKTQDMDTAADITSQVFVKALTNLSAYKFIGFPFSSWLYKIAMNEVNQFYRKSSRERWVTIQEEMVEQLAEDAAGPDTEMIRDHLEGIIHELDDHEVQILELRYSENKSYKEIGYILQLSETNVKTRAFRIIEKIRKKIGPLK